VGDRRGPLHRTCGLEIVKVGERRRRHSAEVRVLETDRRRISIWQESVAQTKGFINLPWTATLQPPRASYHYFWVGFVSKGGAQASCLA
jgi:hypothetical protein